MFILGGGFEEIEMVQQAVAPEVPMGESIGVWIAYFAGAFLVAIGKIRQAVKTGKKKGLTAWQAFLEWLDIAQAATTIGAVWIAGFLYVNRVPEFMGIQMPEITVAAPFAFMLGCLMEGFAPYVVKLIKSKIPFQGKEDK